LGGEYLRKVGARDAWLVCNWEEEEREVKGEEKGGDERES